MGCRVACKSSGRGIALRVVCAFACSRMTGPARTPASSCRGFWQGGGGLQERMVPARQQVRCRAWSRLCHLRLHLAACEQLQRTLADITGLQGCMMSASQAASGMLESCRFHLRLQQVMATSQAICKQLQGAQADIGLQECMGVCLACSKKDEASMVLCLTVLFVSSCRSGQRMLHRHVLLCCMQAVAAVTSLSSRVQMARVAGWRCQRQGVGKEMRCSFLACINSGGSCHRCFRMDAKPNVCSAASARPLPGSCMFAAVCLHLQGHVSADGKLWVRPASNRRAGWWWHDRKRNTCCVKVLGWS